MFDAAVETTTAAASSTCPKCGEGFSPARRNQKFCSRSCQQAATRNSARGPRDVENKQRNRNHYARAAWLCYDLHRMPRDRRLGFMAEIIAAAREHDGQLRVILSDPSLLGARWGDGIGKLYPDSHNNEVRNIAKAADAYCRKFWGHGVRAVVYKQCPEPPTGEVLDEPPAQSALRIYRGEPFGGPAGDMRAGPFILLPPSDGETHSPAP